jgi:hypothetical protein
MQRQLGVFLYDTVDYQIIGYTGLENYMEQPVVPGPDENPIVTKVIIPHSAGRGIFERLELVNCMATYLYDSHEGAALDVINSHNYGRKTGRAWDVRLPPGDD